MTSPFHDAFNRLPSDTCSWSSSMSRGMLGQIRFCWQVVFYRIPKVNTIKKIHCRQIHSYTYSQPLHSLLTATWTVFVSYLSSVSLCKYKQIPLYIARSPSLLHEGSMVYTPVSSLLLPHGNVAGHHSTLEHTSSLSLNNHTVPTAHGHRPSTTPSQRLPYTW